MTLDEKTTPTDAPRASSRNVNQKPPLKSSQSAHFQTLNVTQSAPSVTSQMSDDLAWRLRLRSSDCFEKIMNDIEGKMVEQVKKQQLETTSSQASGEESVVAEKKPILLDLEDDEDETEKHKQENFNSPVRIKARRAWAIIRRYIKEQTMNKQTNSSTLQWSMLKQTLKNMSNMDAAREELYKKYLDPENPRNWTDGIKSIPQGFFARHSKVMMKRSVDKSPPASLTGKKSVKGRQSAYRL